MDKNYEEIKCYLILTYVYEGCCFLLDDYHREIKELNKDMYQEYKNEIDEKTLIFKHTNMFKNKIVKQYKNLFNDCYLIEYNLIGARIVCEKIINQKNKLDDIFKLV